MYVGDNNDWFPVAPGLASVGGQTGTNHGNDVVRGLVEERKRPLNRYTGSTEVFRCPADKGDSLMKGGHDHVFTYLGNSYRVPWWNAFRVKRVIGLAYPNQNDRNTGAKAPPIKGSEVARKPSTKIIQGDWHWHGNRVLTDNRSIWHNYKGKARYNMVFGDGHVEFVRWPDDFAKWIREPVDIEFDWW